MLSSKLTGEQYSGKCERRTAWVRLRWLLAITLVFGAWGCGSDDGGSSTSSGESSSLFSSSSDWYRAGSCEKLTLDDDEAKSNLWYVPEGKTPVPTEATTKTPETVGDLEAAIKDRQAQIDQTKASKSTWKQKSFTFKFESSSVVKNEGGSTTTVPILKIGDATCAGIFDVDGDRLTVSLAEGAKQLPKPKPKKAAKKAGKGSSKSGKACEHSWDCDTSKCINGVCLTKELGTACENSWDCDTSKCSNGVCTSKALGTTCENSWDCDTNKCANGICTSKKDGTACEYGWDCDSSKCENNICVGKKPVAKKAEAATPAVCKGNTFIFTRKKAESCAAPADQADATVAKLEAELKTLEAALVTAKAAEQKKRNTPGSGAMATTYPSACNNLDPDLHTAVKGLEGQCVPIKPGWYWRANKDGRKEVSSPSSYSDSNDFSLLGKPNKFLEESSSLARSDRNKARRAIRARTYTTKSVSCSYTFIEATNRLSAECEFDNGGLYVNGNVSYRKKQKCETDCMHMTCSDPCSSHSDCEGWTCGCSRSRCYWGRCTRCPSECTKICEDPEFIKSGGKPYKVSTKVSKDRVEEAKKLTRGFARLNFKPQSVYRKVFTKKEDGEKSLEHDTGYYVKVTPVRLAVIGSDDQLFTFKGKSKWNFTSELGGKNVKMRCTSTTCTASLKK